MTEHTFNPHGNLTADGKTVSVGLLVIINDLRPAKVVSDDTFGPQCCGRVDHSGQTYINGGIFADHSKADCSDGKFCRHDHWFTVEYPNGNTDKFNGERLATKFEGRTALQAWVEAGGSVMTATQTAHSRGEHETSLVWAQSCTDCRIQAVDEVALLLRQTSSEGVDFENLTDDEAGDLYEAAAAARFDLKQLQDVWPADFYERMTQAARSVNRARTQAQTLFDVKGGE